MAKRIIYFGYGANASVDMIKALIGRAPKGCRARLENYGLFIQHWNNIPRQAQKELSAWDKEFRSYIAVPLKGEAIYGIAWALTEKERDIIGEWELHNKWYKPIAVRVRNEKGRVFNAQTEIITPYDNLKEQNPVISRNYHFFLNSKEKMLKTARKVRNMFEEKVANSYH